MGEAMKIVTNYDPKPIPERGFDWEAVTDNYDLGSPVGHGLTEKEAKLDLLEQLTDYAEDAETIAEICRLEAEIIAHNDPNQMELPL
jgi:hypothetical protein